MSRPDSSRPTLRGRSRSALLPANRTRSLRGEALEDRRLLALTTTDLDSGLTPADLAQALVGSGVTVQNVTFAGSNKAGGLFSGGLSEGLGVESGVVLSSGNIANASGPNDSDSETEAFGTPGDADLDNLIPGFGTNDAAVLEFDFIAEAGTISFLYVFASEEYNEFVNLGFNDVFGFFLDGKNIALIPGTQTPVSIDTVNNGVNSSFYNDNDYNDHFPGPTPFPTQADGFTVVLQATATVTPGTHRIKLAVADVQDFAYDSWVFLGAESFVSGESDLALSATVNDPVIVNNPAAFTFTVTNDGPDPASGVLLESVLPAGVNYLGVSSSQGTASMAGGVVTAELGSLAVGASATVTVTVSTDQLGPLTLSASTRAAQVEPDETNNVVSATTLVDVPRISVGDLQIVEGNGGVKEALLSVRLNAPDIYSTVSAYYTTFDITANAGYDYAAGSGVVVFAPGSTSRTISIPILGDIQYELTESLFVQLSSPVGAEIAKGTGTITILNNDPLPNLYVDDPVITTLENGSYAAVFSVALDVTSGLEVQVPYYTSDGAALEGVDYTGTNGTLVFASGMRTLKVTVPVTTSDLYSANKKFYLNLGSALNANVVDAQGAATIVYAPEPTGEYIVDDGDPAYVRGGTWTDLTNRLAYQLDYDYAPAGNGSSTATWNFVGIPNGSYEVFARWSAFGNRATNATYTMLDNGVSVGSAQVNQQLAPTGDYSNGVYWQSLGFFRTTTNNFAVRLSNAANGYVTADAIRLVAGGIASQRPEMDVSGLQRSIPTEDETPTPEDGTDFGNVPLLTDSAPHKFTITNNGNADLVLTGVPRVSIAGPSASDFTVVSQPASIVAPGKSTTFEVVFHPTAAGARTAVIVIPNNDDTENPYLFAIYGNVPPQADMLVHNAALPQDVNNDSRVNASDALIIINRLLAGPPAQPLSAGADSNTAAPLAAAPSYFYDVNDDARINASDLLMVINFLLQPPSAAPQAAAAVDEALVLFDVPETAQQEWGTRIEVAAASPAVARLPSGTAELLLAEEAASLLLGDDDESSDDELLAGL